MRNILLFMILNISEGANLVNIRQTDQCPGNSCWADMSGIISIYKSFIIFAAFIPGGQDIG